MSGNSGSVDSGKGKRKLVSADSADASATSSKKKKSKHSAATEVTQAIAYNGFQGSINRLTDMFEKSMTDMKDPLAVSKALKMLQQVDDGLSAADKVKVTMAFTEKPVLAEAYLALEEDEVRRGFLHTIIV
jgi:predicted GTPase